jgi:DNA polymerase elongation subunit (family B)
LKFPNCKNLSYKIVINSLYGLTGNSVFKTLYNPIAAGDCTLIVRTWLKKLAKTLEENGFYVLYGFTDSVMVIVPPNLNKSDLIIQVDKFINNINANIPFPQNTFNLEIEKEYKFIWIVSKNCYLWVDKNDRIGYKHTLLDSNTPKIIMQVFDEYVSPKIIKELDVNFTKSELSTQIKSILEKNIELAGEEYNVDKIENYKVKSVELDLTDMSWLYRTGCDYKLVN